MRYEVVTIAAISDVEKWNSPLNLPWLTNCCSLIDLKAIFSVRHEKHKPKVRDKRDNLRKSVKQSFCDTIAVLVPDAPSCLRLSSTTALYGRNPRLQQPLSPAAIWWDWRTLKVLRDECWSGRFMWTKSLRCSHSFAVMLCLQYVKGRKMILKRCDHIGLTSQIALVELYTNDRYQSTYFHYCDSDRRGFYTVLCSILRLWLTGFWLFLVCPHSFSSCYLPVLTNSKDLSWLLVSE
jgi:hypothetical protein